jgi:hypothetical protein
MDMSIQKDRQVHLRHLAWKGLNIKSVYTPPVGRWVSRSFFCQALLVHVLEVEILLDLCLHVKVFSVSSLQTLTPLKLTAIHPASTDLKIEFLMMKTRFQINIRPHWTYLTWFAYFDIIYNLFKKKIKKKCFFFSFWLESSSEIFFFVLKIKTLTSFSKVYFLQ